MGASPTSPGPFIEKLVAKDKGWLAAYFDVLSRIGGSQQAYFTEPDRLRLFYSALRASDSSVKATRGVFRPAPDLLLLVTRMRWDENGQPLVPETRGVEGDPSPKSDSHMVREWDMR